MNEKETLALQDIKEAVQSHAWRVERVITFGGPGPAVQVWRKRPSGKWEKAGPLLFPPDGGTIEDTFKTLGGLAVEA